MTEGFLLVDKPGGWTSHDVIAKLRRLLSIKKMGHAGTLDPMATGLLVVALGRATRLLRFAQDLPKEYVATVAFGVATDSGDADGAVIEEVPPSFTEAELAEVLTRFTGVIDQIPPQVSAIKRGGKRLHELARAGVVVELEPRPVEVHAIEILDLSATNARLRVRCGKGTYIRVLADDIAIALGTRAHLTALRRTATGSLDVEDATTIEVIERLEDRSTLIMTCAEGLRDLPAIDVPEAQRSAAGHGASIELESAAAPGLVRVLDHGVLRGVYRCEDSTLVPEVVLS